MKIRHFILMLLRASGGIINGKTKLQKEMYFISLLLEKDFGFEAHYYGPYSVEIERGLDELIGAGFVNMRREIFGIDYNRGFEVKRYNFSLTESGQRLTEILIKENSDENKMVRGFIEKLKELDSPDYLSLSLAAKAYFILSKEGKPMSEAQIREKAKEFGWNVNGNDIHMAVNILGKLGFAEKQ